MERSDTGRVRLQLEQAAKDVEILERLERDLGFSTKAQVVRAAIRLLDIWCEAIKRGAKIEIVDSDGTRTRVVIL